MKRQQNKYTTCASRSVDRREQTRVRCGCCDPRIPLTKTGTAGQHATQTLATHATSSIPTRLCVCPCAIPRRPPRAHTSPDAADVAAGESAQAHPISIPSTCVWRENEFGLPVGFPTHGCRCGVFVWWGQTNSRHFCQRCARCARPRAASGSSTDQLIRAAARHTCNKTSTLFVFEERQATVPTKAPPLCLTALRKP